MEILQLPLKKVVFIIFEDIIERDDSYDLQGLLKNLIWDYKDKQKHLSSTDDLYNNQELINNLYALKKVRNEIAHQKGDFKKYKIISLLSKTHDFLEYIIENKIGHYGDPIVKEYLTNIESKIDNINNLMVEPKFSSDAFWDQNFLSYDCNEDRNYKNINDFLELYHSSKADYELSEPTTGSTSFVLPRLSDYIKGYALMSSWVNNIYCNLLRLKSNLENDYMSGTFHLLDENDLEYSSDIDSLSKFIYIMSLAKKVNLEGQFKGEKVICLIDKKTIEYKHEGDSEYYNYSIMSVDTPNYPSLIDELIDDINMLLVQKYEYCENLKKEYNSIEIDMTKNKIVNEMYSSDKREKLIYLREEMIKTLHIDRSECILRKTNLDKILKYKVSTLDDLLQFIDIYDQSQSIQKQKLYLESILTIMNSK